MNKLAPEKRKVLEYRIKAKFAGLAVTVWIIYGVYALILLGQIKGIWVLRKLENGTVEKFHLT
jgi:hypothetical protein